MPENSPLTAGAFDRIAGAMIAPVTQPRDRDAILALMDFLRADMKAMREFGVGEAEPATVYEPAAE